MRLVVCAAVLLLAVRAEVPYERLVNAASEPQNWLTYHGDYGGVRHRDLSQINTANVKDLRLEWMFQVPKAGRFETVPLVVDGVMYFTAPDGFAFAVDARSGRELWRRRRPIPENALLVGGSINRGFALLGDRLYMTTPEGHLVCLDSRNGEQLWDVEIGPWQKGYGATSAPLAVKDKLIIGVAGGEFGIRGYLDAYDAATGKRVWRWYSIPGKGEPGNETWSGDSWLRGGAPPWMTGTYDPQLGLLYWGIGNPAPDLDGDVRKGDNLYSASIVALDVNTGKLVWHYQTMPHDTHDWDAAQTPMLADLDWKGQPRKLLFQGNRNGFFYVLDRVTGKFLMAKAFARQNWARGFDENGRPIFEANIDPTPEGNRICPGLAGGANWMAPAFNPQLKTFYLQYFEECHTYFSTPQQYREGKPYWGGTYQSIESERKWGNVKALDPFTGEAKWNFEFNKPSWVGTLSTSGGLLFTGDDDGYLVALDARSGKLLWKINTGASMATAPITFMVKGKQYLTMASGGALLTFALP